MVRAAGRWQPAITAGHPEQSPLWLRVITTDPDDLMPPPDTHKTLTGEQKQLLRQWIVAGAPWEGHWAFVQPRRPELPAPSNPDWVRNPIDAFIAAGLEARELNELNYALVGDPDIHTRIRQFEMAFRMQTSVPELVQVENEPETTYQLYGEEARKPGSFDYTCVLARRLVERGVRFVQIHHNNWDHHGNLGGRLPSQCKDVDQATYGLIQDLKARGLFGETLILWGGEFGRTIYSQGGLTKDNYGRDHHPRCFTMWLAGGGVRGGVVHGETDEFSSTSSRIRSMCATCTPPSSICWGWITGVSRSNGRGWT